MNIVPFPRPPEMSFELLEQTCLNYLSEAQTPIVPVDTLLEFCHRNPALAHVSRGTLTTFLREHEEVELLEGPSPEEMISAEVLGDAGLYMGERAVLKRRIPTRRELHAHMAVQLQAMQEALSRALAAAGPEGELASKRAEITSAINKVQGLLERLALLMR